MVRLEGNEHYVEAALRLLQFVEARRPTGRRFGADADARWNSFRGDLATVDRIELMIRDADAEWPASLGARVVYALPGVPEDEPFGAQWPSLDPVDAETVWRRVKAESAPTTPAAALAAIARAWGVTLAPHDPGAITATDHLVVVGASAIAATIVAFADGAALDWAEQVVVIATAPHERQLAAAATSILNAQRPARILGAAQASGAKPDRGARLVISSDATSSDRAAATAMLAA